MESFEQADQEMPDAPPASQNEAEGDNSTSNPAPATDSFIAQSPPAPVLPTPVISNNAPGFKYKYPEASPTPVGEDDTNWNKIYTAADSRMYNKHGKDANNSRKFRLSGETRKLALTMLEEKKAKEAAGVPPRATPKPKIPAAKKTQPATTKKEPSTGSRDATPGLDMMSMSISEKIKFEGRARKTSSAAPPSNSGTPAPSSAPKMSSPAPPATKVEKPATKKKGTAAPVKKQVKRQKVEGNAGTPSSSARASQTPGPTAASPSSGSESSRSGTLYCICQRPDDHSLMMECVECKDWYHPRCMKIAESDVRGGLVDRFVCTHCTTAGFATTFKRLCRYYNVDKSCRKPARVSDKPPSKYCSDEHKVAFWEFVYSKVRADDKPSMGGALNREEVGALLKACPTAKQFHALGQKPRLPIKEGADPSRPVGLDYITHEEEEEIAALTEKKRVINCQILGFQNQGKLLTMIHERAKLAAKHMGNKDDKGICGYDSRLAFNDVQFLKWYDSKEGQMAFATNVLGPRTEETKEINARIPAPGQAVPAVSEAPDALKDICLLPPRKCKHWGWREIHNQDFTESQQNLRKELRKLEKQVDEVIDDAETREATKAHYADNVAIQLF